MQARKHYTIQVTPSIKVYATPQLLARQPKKSIESALNAVSTLLVADTSHSYYITGIQPSSTIKEGRGLLVNFVDLSTQTLHIEKRFFPSSQLTPNPNIVITEQPLPTAVQSQIKEAEERADTQARLSVIQLRKHQKQKRASLQAETKQAEEKKRQPLASVKKEPVKEKIVSEADKIKLEADKKAEDREIARELFNELKASGKAIATSKEQARITQLQQAQKRMAQEEKHHEQERKNIQTKTVEAGKLFDTDFATDHFSQACQARNTELQMAQKEINDMLAAHKQVKEKLLTATEYGPQELLHRLEKKEIKTALAKLEHAIDKTQHGMFAVISKRNKALLALEKQTYTELQQASEQRPTVSNVLRGAVQAAIDEYCQTVLVNEEKRAEFLVLFNQPYPHNQYKESGLGITLFSKDSTGRIQLDPTLEDVTLLQWKRKIDGVFARTKEGFSQHELLKSFPAVLRKHLQKNLGSLVIDSPAIDFMGVDKLDLRKAVIQKNPAKILPKKPITAQRRRAAQQVAALSRASHLDTNLLKDQLSSYNDILQREQRHLQEIVSQRQAVAEGQKKMTALLEEATAAKSSESSTEAKTIVEALASIKKNDEEITRIVDTLKSFDISLKTAEEKAEKVKRLLQAAEKQIQVIRSAAQVVPEKQLEQAQAALQVVPEKPLEQAQAELYALVKAVLVEQTLFWDQQTIISDHKITPTTEHSKKVVMPTGVGKMIDDIKNIEQYAQRNKAQTALMVLAKTAIARTSFKNSLFSPTRTKATSQLYSIIKECTEENLQDVNKVGLLTKKLKTLQDYQKTHQPQAKNDSTGRFKKVG